MIDSDLWIHSFNRIHYPLKSKSKLTEYIVAARRVIGDTI